MENIEYILKDYNVEKREFEIEDYIYSYFIADYEYKKDFFAKYFIWDICEAEVFDRLRLIFSDRLKFIDFERKLLETTFFNSIGDERYNIYLVLIVENDSQFLRNSMVQNDFRYARKIVLSVNQVANFFVDTIPLQRKREETYILNLVEKRKIINRLQESISVLRAIFYEEQASRIYLHWKDIKETLGHL